MDTEKLIQNMTAALNEAQEIQEQYSRTLSQLEQENDYLTDTIAQYKIGKIATERREMFSKLTQAKTSAAEAKEEADRIRNEYNSKLDQVSLSFKNIQEKQNNIDKYINAEAEKKIANTKRSLNDKYKTDNKKLRKEYNGKEIQLENKLKIYRIITSVAVLIAILTIILSLTL